MPHVFEEREKEEKRGSILPVTISRIRTLIEVQTVIRMHQLTSSCERN